MGTKESDQATLRDWGKRREGKEGTKEQEYEWHGSWQEYFQKMGSMIGPARQNNSCRLEGHRRGALWRNGGQPGQSRSGLASRSHQELGRLLLGNSRQEEV